MPQNDASPRLEAERERINKKRKKKKEKKNKEKKKRREKKRRKEKKKRNKIQCSYLLHRWPQSVRSSYVTVQEVAYVGP